MILVIPPSTFFFTSKVILLDQSITKGLFIGRYLPVHFTTYKEIVAASKFTKG
jgi:hypothetical protein